MGGGKAVVVVVAVLLAVTAVAQNAPAPSSGPVNITETLEKGGQFKRLIRLLTETRVANQIDNQLNSSTEGLTVFAPTDNAFDNLKAGLLNGLSNEKQVSLLLFHILPKYYTQENLLTVSNPVRTQYSQDGLNFTGQSHQVNVSSGLSQTQVNNALRQDYPLAVYVIDVVLLPPSLFTAKPPASDNNTAPPPPKSSGSAPSSNDNNDDNNSTAASSSSSSAILSALLLALASMLA